MVETDRGPPIRGTKKKELETAALADRLDIEVKGKGYIKHTF